MRSLLNFIKCELFFAVNASNFNRRRHNYSFAFQCPCSIINQIFHLKLEEKQCRLILIRLSVWNFISGNDSDPIEVVNSFNLKLEIAIRLHAFFIFFRFSDNVYKNIDKT